MKILHNYFFFFFFFWDASQVSSKPLQCKRLPVGHSHTYTTCALPGTYSSFLTAVHEWQSEWGCQFRVMQWGYRPLDGPHYVRLAGLAVRSFFFFCVLLLSYTTSRRPYLYECLLWPFGCALLTYYDPRASLHHSFVRYNPSTNFPKIVRCAKEAQRTSAAFWHVHVVFQEQTTNIHR